LVTIQLYESYAPAMQALHSGISEEEYLQSYAAQFLNGWTIHFDDPSLPLQGVAHARNWVIAGQPQKMGSTMVAQLLDLRNC